MADGIVGIGGNNNSYYVGGYMSRGGKEAAEEAEQSVQAQAPESKPVDPSKVMDFLASNNFFVAPVETTAVDVDSATEERIGNYMENFEVIYGIIVNEFGEDIAPYVMDIAMDYLMNMAA